MRRVIAYVDGFNLYHAIHELGKPHLKWLDLHALAASMCGGNESITGVYFFTAFATWRRGAVGRHKEYLSALQHAGVRCVIGHFKEKRLSCKSCGAQWIGHEEKESDVALAVQVVADAFTDSYDRAIIISADSDLAPPIRTVRACFPMKTVNVVAPPKRFSHARDLSPIMEITAGRIGKCLLPETATDLNGTRIFSRPADYAPPIAVAGNAAPVVSRAP